MSPQRRKGRGGGAGKVAALPQSAGDLAIESSRQRHRVLPGLLPASCKSSMNPSTTLSAKSKSKERPKAITASSIDACLSASSLCSAHAAAKLANSADCFGPPHASSSRAISRPRKYAHNINHKKASLIESANACASTQRSSRHSKGMQASSKPSDFKHDSSRIDDSCSRKNRSCRNSIQKKEACNDFRQPSLMSFSPQAKRVSTAGIKSCLAGRPKECLNAACSYRRSSLEGHTHEGEPLYVLSPDRRYSMGPSVMTITTSLQSECEECPDADKHVGLLDGKGEKHTEYPSVGILVGQFAGPSDVVARAGIGKDLADLTSDELSGNLLRWQEERTDACNYQRSKSDKSAINVGITSSTAVGALSELDEDWKTISGTHVEAADLSQISTSLSGALSELDEDWKTISGTHVDAADLRRISTSLSGSNKKLGYVHLVDVLKCDSQQSVDDNPNNTNSLHQRLALLEGKVSQIASELRKTKAMLDVNNPAESATLLSDIQGKISSIQQAMTERTDHKFAKSHNNNPLEENEQSSCVLNDDLSHQDSKRSSNVTSGDFNIPAVMELLQQNPPSTSSNSTSRKTERLKYDQQELEDRLFPHRKLLRSRLSLRNGVMESRAALHSKLEDAVPQGHSADHVHFAGPLQLSKAKQPSLRHMTGIEQAAQNVGNFDAASHLHERMCSSNCSKFHLENCYVDSNPPTAIKRVISDLDYTGQPNGDVQSSNIEPLDLKMQCPSLPYLREDSTQVADSTLHLLQCDETLQLNSSDAHQELGPDNDLEEECDELQGNLCPISHRVATGGWYACDGEAILLVHEDGCCSFYDVANMEEKALYNCPEGYPAISWRDCWVIRAAGSDGRANKYVVASTCGSALDAGFCSWDFHSKVVTAYHMEDHFLDHNALPQCSPPKNSKYPELQASRSLCGLESYSATISQDFWAPNLSHANMCKEFSRWWYRPCGPLMVSAGSSARQVAVYDIRDGEKIMTWESKQPIKYLDFSSPVQWRHKGTLALAEEQAVSVWDVNTLNAHCLHYIELSGKQICAFYVHNGDAEYSGGVRQKLSSSDMEAFDGICCTQDDINVLDFRVPNGVGISLPTPRQETQSVYARGDMVLIGGINMASNQCVMQQWSTRMGQMVCKYAFRPSSPHMHLSLSQVWGNSNTVMAVNGNGLHIFKGDKENCYSADVEDVKGMPALFNPSFDYANAQILLISRDRPASWCYWAM